MKKSKMKMQNDRLKIKSDPNKIFGEHLNIYGLETNDKKNMTFSEIEETKKNITSCFLKLNLKKAEELASCVFENYNNTSEFSIWYFPQLKKNEKKLQRKIKELFDNSEANHAIKLYENNEPYIKVDEYESCLSNAVSRIEQNIIEKFKNDSSVSAEVLYKNNSRVLGMEWYEKEKCKGLLISEIRSKLNNFNFEEADAHFLCNNKRCLLKEEDYLTHKSEAIKVYFLKKFELKLDGEQSMAIADMSNCLLVTARAGSGKTRTLAAKAVFLSNQYNIEPNHILLLAFNTNAAKEIKSRISGMCPDKEFNNIRTFHSLACGVLNRPDIEPNPERFVDNAIKDSLSEDEEFKKNIYQYFKNDTAKIENGLTTEEYNSIRNKGISVIDCNKVYISIGGRYVKSRGEKWIADFLFEHELTHDGKKVWCAYEKPHRNSDGSGVGIIKPDFTFGCAGDKEYSFVLEHWAIDEMGFYPDIPIWENSKTTYKRYDEIRKRKRKYFGKKGKLIETYPKNMKNGRVEFENKLKVLFSERNIQCVKKEDSKLYGDAFDRATNRLRTLFLSFIQRCAQKKWSVEEVQGNLENHSSCEAERVFLDASIKIYRRYREQFYSSEENSLEKYDYSMLLPEATKKIKGDCLLKLKVYDGERVTGNIKVKDIKYILVDEYQDFSQLFYNFIKAVKDHSGARLFCVGDNCQAINGFAGSDLTFFKNFEGFYEQTSRRDIVTNYRSCEDIVERGNRLMGDFGKRAKASNKTKGSVETICIDNYFVDYSNQSENKTDAVYVCRYSDGNAIDTKASMLLKVVHTILSKP